MKLAFSQQWWLKQKQRTCILRRCFLKYPQWEFKPCRLSIFHIRTNMFSCVYIRTQCVFHILESTCPVNELYSFHLPNTSRHFSQKTHALSKCSHKIVWTYWRSITTQTIFSDIQIRGVWWRWFTWLNLVNLPVLAEEDARYRQTQIYASLCADAFPLLEAQLKEKRACVCV